MLQDLDTPVFVTSWPNNPDVLVVAERGTAKITRHDLTSSGGGGGGGLPPVPTLVLDLSGTAFIPGVPNQEFIGVTGFAFHPEFNDDRNKRFLYVRYNEDNSAAIPPNVKMVIERYHIPAGTLSADPTSATLVYENETIVETSHGGGQIHFDTVDDGPEVTKLYFAIPDNWFASATCCERVDVQKDYDPALPDTHWGKLFCVDVEQVTDQGPPPTPDVLAKGLRNPHAFSVDRGDSVGQGLGDVWVGNTGKEMTGDVFRWVTGTSGVLNYGWPWKHGDAGALLSAPHTFVDTDCNDDPSDPCKDPGGNVFTDPAYVVRDLLTNDNHDALIGGYVSRGSGGLQDMYVFAIFGAGQSPMVFAVDAADPGNNLPVDLSSQLGTDTWPGFTLNELGQDSAGGIYIIRVDSPNNETLDNGTIYKILQ